MTDKPRASDYLEVIASPTEDGQYYLRVKHFGGSGAERWKQVGVYPSRTEAETAMLTIGIAMRWFQIDIENWERHNG